LPQSNLRATKARENGETKQWIHLLPAWREAPCFTDRERGRGHASAYEALKAHFSKEEAINMINRWNRIAVVFGHTWMQQPSSPPQSRRHNGRRKVRRCSGGFRPAASETHARCVPNARLRIGCRRYRAGNLHLLDEADEVMCASRKRSSAARSQGFASTSSNRRGGQESHILVPGCQIPSWKSTKSKTSPYR
jgi:hypothetical protein